jgi:UDP-GlcNAc:undecaprenyl-phosphate GlcNAc-1-phosphate transferase
MRNILESLHAFLDGIPIRWLFLLVFSFLLAFVLTLVFRRLATKFKILDHPEERKIHEQPIPLLGGLAIYVSYVMTIFLNFSFSPQLKGVILGGTVILLVGLIDDVKKLPATWKLMAQVLATGILILYGVRLSFLPNNWWGIGGEMLLTLIWVVGITNAVNFFDGMDGLAAGSIAICSSSFFIVGMLTDQPYLAYLTITLAGSCLAFLIFNFKPASIFGSTFLGFTVAGIAVMGGWAQDNPKVALSLPLLILSVFIFDLVYISLSRIYRGRVKNLREWIEYTGKDHLHHRLVALGLTEPQAVLFIYLIAACLGITGIILRASGDLVIFLEILQGAIIFAIIVILMRTGRKSAKDM